MSSWQQHQANQLRESISEARADCGTDILAADIAEAILRMAGMSYMDMLGPVGVALVAAAIARGEAWRALPDVSDRLQELEQEAAAAGHLSGEQSR